MGTDSAKSKVQIIKVSSTSPLAFYSLIILTLAGLVGALGWVETPENKRLIIVGIFVVILAMIVFVGASMFSKRGGDEMDIPGHGSLLGEQAMKGFFDGGNSARLEGRWEVAWSEYDDAGNPKPYTAKDDNSGEDIPYPNDIVSVKVKGSMISAEAHDQTTRRVYYLEGRISNRDTVTLLYWSQPGVAESMLVGVVYLTLNTGYNYVKMEGQWMGYDRDDESMVRGEVHWEKLTID